MAKRKKEVKISVDEFGQMTSDASRVVGTVKAVIGIKDPVSSVLVIDKDAKRRVSNSQEDVVRMLKLEGVLDPQVNGVGADATSEPVDAKTLQPLSPETQKALNRYIGSQIPDITPAEPSLITIPKHKLKKRRKRLYYSV